jgi:hypothetical protein
VDKRSEVQELLQSEIQALRKMTYAQLCDLFLPNKVITKSVASPSGRRYQIETFAVYDDGQSGNLRVLVGIDDGGLRALLPWTDDFIMTPDGTFVGE